MYGFPKFSSWLSDRSGSLSFRFPFRSGIQYQLVGEEKNASRRPIERSWFLIAALLIGTTLGGLAVWCLIPRISYGKDMPRQNQSVVHTKQLPRAEAIVFYGREEYVSVLDCYLKKNLKENGGILDAVQFVNYRSFDAKKDPDSEYLERLVNTSTSYSSRDLQHQAGWQEIWKTQHFRNDTLYFKLDDDVVFIEDGTMEEMAHLLVNRPDFLVATANEINNPEMDWRHLHTGAIKPYLPETIDSSSNASTSLKRWPRNNGGVQNAKLIQEAKGSWRASELPTWSGPRNVNYSEVVAAPRPGHRWLPCREQVNIDGTPLATVEYATDLPWGYNWMAAAQAHYSFLDSLETNDLGKFRHGTWDHTKYEHFSINFIAFWGKDIIGHQNNFEGHSDEYWMSKFLPQKLGRHTAVVERTAVHMAFSKQRDAFEGRALLQTDLMDRYRAYAQEMVCKH